MQQVFSRSRYVLAGQLSWFGGRHVRRDQSKLEVRASLHFSNSNL